MILRPLRDRATWPSLPLAGHSPTDPRGLDRPDETWLALADGTAVGTVSLWQAACRTDADGRTGAIGHFAARDGAVAAFLLSHACERLSALGCTQAVGPMDGSTWRGYRLSVDGVEEPAFPLDRATPSAWLAWFEAAGFALCARYASAVLDAPAIDALCAGIAPRADETRIDDAAGGLSEADLREIGALANEAFTHNPYFRPIAPEAFAALYAPLLAAMDPRFMLLARDGEGLAGIHLALPCPEGPGRRARLVCKTIAVHPRRRGSLLATRLTAEMILRGRAMGLEEVIIALMHDDTLSARWTNTRGRIIRRYGLMGRSLQCP